MSQENAKQQIKELLEKYDKVVEEKRFSKYNEEMTKAEFIEPLFEALGWDVRNKTHPDEVIREERISKGRVDYSFRINGIPKFFLEAKALKEDLDKPEFAKQAINYAWHRGCTWAVLTDFDQGVKIFNAEWKTPILFHSHFKTIPCQEFLDRFEELWLLSRESFEQGLLDKEAEKVGKKSKSSVGEQLFKDLTTWRSKLSKDILARKKDKRLTEEDLDEAVQRIIDRLIFIRNCEDRELEPPKLISTMREWESKCKGALVGRIREVFEHFDKEYNSKLFQKHLCDELDISNQVLEEIINGLDHTEDKTIKYDFSALDADVLGNVYEQYLGHVLKKTAKRATLTEKYAHRKEQGIYYTPTYIVDYIVRNTLGELLKNKKVNGERIRVLDPACGSGSFLIKAFDILNEFYSMRGDHDQTQLDLDTGLPFKQKEKVLLNNIFGVDLDAQAVEIAQLNLLLKIAEKGHRLPLLQKNIKCGNSLIDDEKVVGEKAFKWKEEFKQIMVEGGFDVVIGNPPYIRLENLKKNERAYFFSKFNSAVQKCDIFSFFIEQAISKLRIGGLLSFIVSSSWLSQHSFNKLRRLILEKCLIRQIIKTPKKTFQEASVDTIILVLQKFESKDKIEKNNILVAEILPNGSLKNSRVIPQSVYEHSRDNLFMLDWNPITDKIDKRFEMDTLQLSEICDLSFGIMTGDDSKFTYFDKKHPEEDKKVLRGGNIKRYNILWSGEYVWYNPKLMKQHKETARPANPKRFENEKIIIKREGAGTITAALDKENFYTIGSTFIVNKKDDRFDLRYILALLNSKLLNYWYGKRYKTITQSINSYQKIPIKIVYDSQQQPPIKLVDKILSLNKRLSEIGDKKTDERRRLEEEINKTNVEIDELVYKLYGITEKEKKIIKESLK